MRRNVDENGNNIQDNYRPTQALNDRTVFYSSLNAGEQCPEPTAPKKGDIDNNAPWFERNREKFAHFIQVKKR